MKDKFVTLSSLKKFKENGHTIIFISHKLNESEGSGLNLKPHGGIMERTVAVHADGEIDNIAARSDCIVMPKVLCD